MPELRTPASRSDLRLLKRLRRITSGDRGFYLLLSAPILLVLLLTSVPLVLTAYYSLLDWNLARPLDRAFVGAENYGRLLTNSLFWTAVYNSFYQVFGTVVLQVLIGIPVALLLNRDIAGIRVLRTLYLFPMMTTPIVVGLTWRMLLNTEFGVVNYALGSVGLPTPNWLGHPTWAMPSIILTDVWLSTPFVALIVLAGLQTIPEELYEAARVDGATGWSQFWAITLPLLKPVLLIAVLFRIMDAFKRFDTILIMTGGGPGTATETLNLHAYFHGFQYLNMGYAAAITMLMLTIVLALSTALVLRSLRD